MKEDGNCTPQINMSATIKSNSGCDHYILYRSVLCTPLITTIVFFY